MQSHCLASSPRGLQLSAALRPCPGSCPPAWCNPPLSRYPRSHQVQTQNTPGRIHQLAPPAGPASKPPCCPGSGPPDLSLTSARPISSPIAAQQPHPQPSAWPSPDLAHQANSNPFYRTSENFCHHCYPGCGAEQKIRCIGGYPLPTKRFHVRASLISHIINRCIVVLFVGANILRCGLRICMPQQCLDQ